jgi:hypothetical protein
MTPDELLRHNRVILTHFDSYSVALVFPRWEHSLLWPQALPQDAAPMPAPAAIGQQYLASAVKQAVLERLGFQDEDLEHVGDFQHWAQTPQGPVRIHLLRFTTPDAPKTEIAALGGVFKSMSELRGSAMSELLLLREVFNLIVASGGG